MFYLFATLLWETSAILCPSELFVWYLFVVCCLFFVWYSFLFAIWALIEVDVSPSRHKNVIKSKSVHPSHAAFSISDVGGFTLQKSEIIRLEVLFWSIILGLGHNIVTNRENSYQTNN